MTPDPPVASAAALDGLTVIDLSPTRVGAQVSQVLADFGADVLWIEPPGGSALRDQPAFPFFARGKQSIELDLKQRADRDTLLGLARDADVLIETFRPGVADRLGLGFERLAADNPRIVYASITGFGRTGPYAAVKGYEGLVMAKLGVNAAFRAMTRASRPPFVDTPWCSFSASQTALHAILAALYERERSGLGQRVEANLVQGFAALDTWAWFLHLIAERWPEAYEAVAVFDDDGVPASPFPYMLLNPLTKDGRWLQFAQVRPHLFVALMRALGLEWMLTDPALGRHSGVRGCRTPPRALGEDARGRGREDARRVGGDLRRRSRRLRRAVPPRPRGPRPSPAGPRRSGRGDRAARRGGRPPTGPPRADGAHTRLGVPSRPESRPAPAADLASTRDQRRP